MHTGETLAADLVVLATGYKGLEDLVRELQAALGEAPQHGILKLCGLVLDGDVLVRELTPHGDDLGDPRGVGVMAHGVRGHGRDILGDQPGIEPIVLARAPRARANCRSRLGLMRRTDRPAVSKARRTPRS